MGKPKRRFVAKAESETGWRIWDNLQKKWWGERYVNFPEQLLTELNNHKRPDELKELIRQTPRKRAPRKRA
jgi:hypothetical protein